MAYTQEEQRVLKAVGRRLREQRIGRGLSQEQLALVAGLDRTYVGSVERGRRNIAVLNLVRLAAALGVPASELIRGVEVEPADEPAGGTE